MEVVWYILPMLGRNVVAKDQKRIVSELVQARKEAWRPTIAFLEWAGRQPRDEQETAIENLERELNISKTEMYELVRGIIDIEIGDRTIGRHGAKSRIHWRYALPDIDRCSRGKASTLEPIEAAKFAQRRKKVPVIDHVIQLRPDFVVKFSLPQDLSPFEVERLKKFIDTCVMEDKK
jgi:hypothetical protein